ncbi:hypothetical protein pv_308 [Pithovirus sibericum]|uniref:Ankyrin-repeat protein n=1 Tax=Pithovirus sibericum TaxID=1450746 RepID=W5SAR7_9VIRU|nr:hypothetical protein pv_308 [Pithovirus sibericum]AHH01875.1 hypothetical protein pv_308 [Pithovirus sibericum]
MAIPTLRSLILNELSFDSLLEFEKDPNFSPYLGWEFWADKLEKERQIPKDFFYLVRKKWALEAGLIKREMSPSDRYLELASEFEFFPQSESLREVTVNLKRSLNRADEDEISYWVSRLSEKDIEIVKGIFSSRFSDDDWELTPENFAGYRIVHKLLYGKEVNFVVNYDGDILTWQEGDQKFKIFDSERLSGYLLYQQDSEHILDKAESRNDKYSHLNCYLKTRQVEDNSYHFYCRRRALQLLISHGNLQVLRKVIELHYKGCLKTDLTTIFCWCLESGKIEMVDTILPVLASSLSDEGEIWSGKVCDLIPLVEFSHTNKCQDFSKGGKYDLTQSRKPGWKVEDGNTCIYLEYAVRSGNPQIVDFVCSLQGIDLANDLFWDEDDDGGYNPDKMAFLLQELFEAMEEKPTKFFGFYQILQRILPSHYFDNIEFVLRNCPVDVMNLILSWDFNDDCRTNFLNQFISQSEEELNKQKFLSSFVENQ